MVFSTYRGREAGSRGVSLGMLAVCGLACSAVHVARAGAQWIPDYRVYGVQRIGLLGPEQTGSAGLQSSSVSFLRGDGSVFGFSNRYRGVDTDNGRNAWYYNASTGMTVQMGLTGAAHTGSLGYQFSSYLPPSNAGRIAGFSDRITGVDTQNGQDVWVFDPTLNVTTQIGLFGGAYTGSSGYQFSRVGGLSASGLVGGYSSRITGAQGSNGQNAWLYNSTTNTTAQLGLTSAIYTGPSGFQYSDINRFNEAGQAVGYSLRVSGISTNAGQDTWFYNPTTNTSVQIGLTGGVYTLVGFKPNSKIDFLNEAGQVAGSTRRFTGNVNVESRDTWVYRPSTNTTVQIGLTGGEYVAEAGNQFSNIVAQSQSGRVIGYSRRYTGELSPLGQDAWVYDPSSQLTLRIGLTGAEYTGSTGYRSSLAVAQNEAGQVVGYSQRNPQLNRYNPNDAWVYDIATNTTTQIGLTGPEYTGSGGYRESGIGTITESGLVFGGSQRIRDVNTVNGYNAWIHRIATNTTVRVGLAGVEQTGVDGYQETYIDRQIDSGYIIGFSTRSPSPINNNGRDMWVYDLTTNNTVQVGLTGASFTGSSGYRLVSAVYLSNSIGQIAGFTYRIAGERDLYGQNAWYFDPLTNATSAIIGSVRTADNYSFSQGVVLTEGGFLLGNYMFFGGGVGGGEQRAFIFRPDLGMTDLGNLVDGGLSTFGWSVLQDARFSDALRTIVGYGYVNGQTSGQSVFVLNVPAPGAGALLAFGLIAVGRRRKR